MSYGVRQKFYKSKLWQQVKNNVWLKQSCLCAICGRPVYVSGISEYLPKEKRTTGIVHHKEHLTETNIFDENITINEDNLIGVCKWCHEHKCHNECKAKRDTIDFDENGNVIKGVNP